jgi:DNA topoisomerase VI subunit B
MPDQGDRPAGKNGVPGVTPRDALAPALLARTTFRTSRALDFSTRQELTAQTGHPEEDWPLVALKELADNAIDACEDLRVAPVIGVTVDERGITVTDNGPGLPADTLDGVVDFSLRVSSRMGYVAPDRGAQGNALMTIVAMPFVLDGSAGQVEVEAHGRRQHIGLHVDRIRQVPVITRVEEPSDVRTGTSFHLAWPESASGILIDAEARFLQLAADFAILNPHLTLSVDWFGTRVEWAASSPDWAKWRPSDPTSPWWYRVEDLERLIAAYISHDADKGRERTVQQLAGEFRGLSATAKQKAIGAATGLARAHLNDLVIDGALDRDALWRLLNEMQARSRPVKPAALGVIGQEHLAARLAALGVEMDSFDYHKKEGVTEGLPWVVEAAFGWLGDQAEGGRRLATGVNWSPAIVNPFRELGGYGTGLDAVLAEQRAGYGEPIVLVLHLACPRVVYLDRGKSAVVVADDLGAAILDTVESVTRKWARQRKAEERAQRQAINRRSAFTVRRTTIKDAAAEILPEAYRKVSSDGRWPAEARQMMYASRPYIQKVTGKPLRDDYFIQQVLAPYVDQNHPDWDIVYEARGALHEPHTGRSVPLGTLEVREYVASFGRGPEPPGRDRVSTHYPTHGPRDRYGAVLVIEKEGFGPLLTAAGIAERFDIAPTPTKGLSVTACRQLAEQLGVPLLVLHDFDQAGFAILGTLGHSTRRYRFRHQVQVVDLGLTLTDIKNYHLEAEYQKLKHSPAVLRRNGASEEDIAFLSRNRRVELNMLTSEQFVELVEARLVEKGVQKIVPEPEVLETAYRRAYEVRLINAAVQAAAEDAAVRARAVVIPDHLSEHVRAALKANPRMPWDDAIARLVGYAEEGDRA